MFNLQLKTDRIQSDTVKYTAPSQPPPQLRPHLHPIPTITVNKMLSYRKETTLQGVLVLAKVEDWNWETIFYGHYRSIFNHCKESASKAIEFGDKTHKGLLRRSRSFKVIEVDTKRKPVCDFLLVINSK